MKNYQKSNNGYPPWVEPVSQEPPPEIIAARNLGEEDSQSPSKQGLTEFEIAIIQEAVSDFLHQDIPKGKNKKKTRAKIKKMMAVFMEFSLSENKRIKSQLAQKFRIHESTVRYWIKKVSAYLAENIRIKRTENKLPDKNLRTSDVNNKPNDTSITTNTNVASRKDSE